MKDSVGEGKVGSKVRAQAVRWKIARRHRTPRRRHWLRWVFLALFLLLLASSGGAAAGGLYFASQLPPASKFHVHYGFQDARIYDSRGELLFDMANLARRTQGYRVVEPLQALHDRGSACASGINRIPLLLQNATIATEDATFYKNPGFDPLSIVRAAYQNLRYGHIVSGASTITQQVVRDYFLKNDQQTLTRKAQEVALSYQISQRIPKRKILWYYLNSVPYGNLAYGAQAASHVYFNQAVCRLDLAQAALLAGLPRGPGIYDPVRHRGAAVYRMYQVLKLMHQHGYLHSRAAITAAMREASRWRFSAPQPTMRYPQFVQYVIDQLKSTPQLRSQLYKGIDVYTTLNPQLQNMAQQTVRQSIDGLRPEHVTNGALVSLDLRPGRYGWIDAMVGSAHYADKTGQINMATTPRQPGSSMKPFNYIWAFTNGHVSPATTVVDAPIRLPDPNDPEDGGWYQPDNYDRKYHGTVTLRQALDNSLNVPAVKVEYYVTTPRHVAQTAYTFGMKSLYRDNPHLDCSVCYAVTLGGLTRGTRLLEETAAYGVFATSGVTVPPVAIWQIVKRNTGKVLFCSSSCPRGVKPSPLLAPAAKRVLDRAHAYEMTDVLSDNSSRCTIQVCEFGLNSPLLLSRPAAAKTGTTNSFTDNWTVGYTPQIVTGAWAGNADRTPMQDVTGIMGAAPIWHAYMENAFKMLRLPVENFVQPPNVVESNQCSIPGSSARSYGATDIQVLPESVLPLCYLPDRGANPYTCSGSTYSYGYGYATPIPCTAYNPQQPYSQPYGQTYQQPYTYQAPVNPAPVNPPPLPAPAVPRAAPTSAPQPAPQEPATSAPVQIPPGRITPPTSPPAVSPP